MVTTADVFHTCDACGYEAGGYAKKELLTDGWRWHDAGKGRLFVMCGSCMDAYEPAWTAKAAA